MPLPIARPPDDDYDPVINRRRQRANRRDFLISVAVVSASLTFVLGMAALVIHLLNRDRDAATAKDQPRPVVRTGHFVIPKSRTAEPEPPPAQPKTTGTLDPAPSPPQLPPVQMPDPTPQVSETPDRTRPRGHRPDPEPSVAFPQSELRPSRQATPGYYARTIHGFRVLISEMAYNESDAADRRPLGYLEAEFARIADLLPPDALKVLARVPVWVEWDHTRPESVTSYAVYYGAAGEGLYVRGVDPRKARCVCLLSLKTAIKLRSEGSKRLVVLHELAHAVHDQHLGIRNPFVANAYDQAMARRLYDEVRHIDGTERKGYAAANEAEYFAELTCAYLDRLNYTPTGREELREHDSVGYELMAKVWGTPEQIEARRKKAKPLK